MCFNIKAEAMALSFVTEDLVSLRDVLEDLLGARLLVLVRMVFERQPAVGALDLVLGGPGLQPQQLVVVLMGHGATMSEAECLVCRYIHQKANITHILIFSVTYTRCKSYLDIPKIIFDFLLQQN